MYPTRNVTFTSRPAQQAIGYQSSSPLDPQVWKNPIPKKLNKEMAGADAPNDWMLKQSGKNNLDLAYDKVKVGGASVSAGMVCGVFSTTAFEKRET